MPARAPTGGLVYSTEAGRMCPTCRRAIGACNCAATAAVSAKAAAAGSVVRIRREVGGRGGKTVTVVTGLALEEAALIALSKRLKAACGTGGTVKAGVLEFQGDHRDAIADLLARAGIESKRAGG